MKTKLLFVTCLALQFYGSTLPGLAQSATVEFTLDSFPVAAFGELTFALKLSAPLSQPAEIGVELFSSDPNEPWPDGPWLAGFVTIPVGDTNRSVTFLTPGLAMFGGQIRLSGEASPINVTPGEQSMARLVPLKEPVSVRFNLQESNASVSVWLDGIISNNVNVNYTIQAAPPELLPRGTISAVPGRDFDPVSGALALTSMSSESIVTIPIRPHRDPLVPPAFVVFKLSTTNDVWLPQSELLVEIPSLLSFSGTLAIEGNPAAFNGVPFWSFGGPVSFHYATRERTALAGLDFAPVEGDVSTDTNGFGFIALSILDNGLVEPTKEFDLVLSRPDTGEVFRTLPIRIEDNEIPLPAERDPTFQVSPNLSGSQVWVRPDGTVLVLDSDNFALHFLPSNGALENTVALGPTQSSAFGNPGVLERSGGLLLNADNLGASNRLSLDRATSIQRIRADGTIDREFRILALGSSAWALNVDVEGRILVGVASDDCGQSTWLLRYLPDGTRDASFEPRAVGGIVNAVALRPDGRFNVIAIRWRCGLAMGNRVFPRILTLTEREAAIEEVGSPGEFSPAYLVTSNGWYVFDWPGFDTRGIEGIIKVSSDGRRVPDFFLPGFPFSSNPRLAAVQSDGKVLAFIEGEPGIGLVRFEATTSQQASQIDANPIQFAWPSSSRAVVLLGRAGDTTISQSVHYATKDGSAKAGVDYIGSSGLVTFQPLEIEKRIEIELLAGASSDPLTSFFVTLSDPTDGATLGTSDVSLRILDIGSTLAISRGKDSITLLVRAFSGGNSFRLVLEKSASLASANWQPLIDPATGQEAARGLNGYVEYSIQLPVPQGQSFFRARLSPW
jgi:hypothetical protein